MFSFSPSYLIQLCACLPEGPGLSRKRAVNPSSPRRVTRPGLFPLGWKPLCGGTWVGMECRGRSWGAESRSEWLGVGELGTEPWAVMWRGGKVLWRPWWVMVWGKRWASSLLLVSRHAFWLCYENDNLFKCLRRWATWSLHVCEGGWRASEGRLAVGCLWLILSRSA